MLFKLMDIIYKNKLINKIIYEYLKNIKINN